MSRKRRHRHNVTQFDDEHRTLIKGISVAAGVVLFAVAGVVLMLRGFVN